MHLNFFIVEKQLILRKIIVRIAIKRMVKTALMNILLALMNILLTKEEGVEILHDACNRLAMVGRLAVSRKDEDSARKVIRLRTQ